MHGELMGALVEEENKIRYKKWLSFVVLRKGKKSEG